MPLPDALASSLSGIQANFRELDKRLQQLVSNARGVRGDFADYSTSGDLAAHEADTTDVHGIADTTVLATDAELAAHEADTTNVHGIADTSLLARKDTKADLPASVAYEDEANTFTAEQTLSAADFLTGWKVTHATNSDTAELDSAFVEFVRGSGGSLTLLRARQAADGFQRFQMQLDGVVTVGDGTVTATTANFRSANSIQTQDALLDAIAALSMIDNRIIVGTGADTVELWTVTDFVKTLLDDADAATARTTLLTGTPAARATRTAVQTITTATNTLIAFDAEDYDTATMHDTVTNNSRITAPVAGIYAIATSIRWVANSTGERRLRIFKNGAAVNVNDRRDAATAPTTTDVVIYTELSLAANDYIEAECLQTSGGNLDIANPTLSVRWVAPPP